MMTSTHTRRRSGRAAALVGALLLMVLWCTAVPAVAAEGGPGGDGPIGDAPGPTVGDAMQAKVADLSAHANGGFTTGDTLLVYLSITNRATGTRHLRLPRGTLFATEDTSEQTAVVSGLTSEQAATADIEPVLTLAPGVNHFTLQGYCAQHDDSGPATVKPMRYAGVAAAPLPTVLRNIVAEQPSLETAQSAVWWVTDEATYPVADARVRPLLAGIDAKAFHDEPSQVVPDAAYQPQWAPVEESADSYSYDPGPSAGGGGFLVFGLVLAAFLALILFAVFRTRGRPIPAAVSVSSRGGHPHARSGSTPPGWYADPSGSGARRWWDGTRWTDHRA